MCCPAGPWHAIDEKLHLTGSVRPWLATKVDPAPATGSPQIALAVCGATYVAATLNVPSVEFPHLSAAVHVTVVVPGPMGVPIAGRHSTVGAASAISVATGFT